MLCSASRRTRLENVVAQLGNLLKGFGRASVCRFLITRRLRGDIGRRHQQRFHVTANVIVMSAQK
jgi:hypothetical protein